METKVLLATSKLYSNVLVGHTTGSWAFTKKNHDLDNNRIVGSFITIYCSEAETPGTQGIYGLGFITGPQIPGKVKGHRWVDSNYYGLIPFTSLSQKFISKEILSRKYGSSWSHNPFNVNSDKLPKIKFTDDLLKEFLSVMLT